MESRLALFLLIGACASHVGSRSLAGQDINTKGAYSRSAVNIWGIRTGVVVSPDGKKRIVVQPPRRSSPEGENHFVFVEALGQRYPTEIGQWVNAEVAWSPDSKAFFATYSDGGNIGTYHVKVFYLNPAGLRLIEPIRNGRRLFAPRCFDPELPNVAAIKWTQADASRLLIALEVPPHSSCASMGTFRAFEIELPDGNVLTTYDQLAAKKLFLDDLGAELRDADDACIRTPGKCVPAGLANPPARRR